MTDVDIAKIPKAEMHLHIEGAMRRATYVEFRRRQEPSYSLDQSPWFDDDYRFDNLGHFLETASPCVITSAEDYYRMAAELFEDLLTQNVIYAEISIASHQVPIDEIASAIHEAWLKTIPNRALEFGILVGLFRSDGPELAAEMIAQGIRAKKFGVVGIDLLEHESANAASAFEGVYAMAREAGLGLRAHAGEGEGADSVWDAIRELGVTRIAHGTRSVEDPALVRRLADSGIVLDMCPTSNYRLHVVDSMQDHPVRRLFDSGVKITVSSDDPLFFNSDISDEFVLMQDVFGFTTDELLTITRTAVDGAFTSEEKKNRLRTLLVQHVGDKQRRV